MVDYQDALETGVPEKSENDRLEVPIGDAGPVSLRSWLCRCRVEKPWPDSFHNTRLEEEFVNLRLPQARRATKWAGLVWFLSAVLFGVVPPPQPWVSVSQALAVAVRISAMLAGAFMAAFANCFGEVRICMAWAAIFFFNLALNRYRTSWVVGEDPVDAWDTEEVLTSDSLMLLCMVAVQTAFFLAVPVRLKRGWFLAFLPAFFYMVTTLPLDETGPEMSSSRRLMLVIVQGVIGWFGMIGQGRLETTERAQFFALKQAHAEVVRERVLRYEAEHEAEVERQQSTSVPVVDRGERASEWGKRSIGHSNLGSMTSTEVIFDSLNKSLILEVGMAEHWVLSGMNFSITDTVLGSGGFGTVKRGFLCGVPVAVKVSKNQNTESDESGSGEQLGPRDVCNEIRMCRRVRHPNIACFFGIHVNPGQELSWSVVMEEVVGPSLHSFIVEEHHRVKVATRIGLLMDTCSALWYLHELTPQIVHGDLKDSNIIVETGWEFPRAKLIDFGLSRVVSQHTTLRGGSFAWAPPEFFLKERPTAKFDVFSFGRLIYFVITALPPCISDRSTLRKMAQSGFFPPLLWPDLPYPFAEDCKTMCEACLSFSVDSRPPINKVFDALLCWNSHIVAL